MKLFSYNFIRQWNLIAEDAKGSGLDLSKLRCVFSIEKKDTVTPNTGVFIIYNATKNTIASLQKDFKKLIVNGGYESNNGLLFNGNIKGFEVGRDKLDTFIKLSCGDGDKAFNYTVINTTLAKGANADSIYQEASSSLGLNTNYKSELKSEPLPRGKVLYGRPQEFLKELAFNNNSSFSIQDGEILFLNKSDVLPSQAVLINSNNGMIGSPSLTDNGVQCVCLINPLLKVGVKVQIESEFLNGQFRIIEVKHHGDTQGNEFYTEFKGLNLDSTSNKVGGI